MLKKKHVSGEFVVNCISHMRYRIFKIPKSKYKTLQVKHALDMNIYIYMQKYFLESHYIENLLYDKFII